MHMPEPLDRSVLHSTLPTPAPGPEPWRAELASRVSSYRARKNRTVEQETLALDFEAPGLELPDEESPAAIAGAEAAAVHQDVSPQDVPPKDAPSQPEHSTVDTNYYRRLNARASQQSAQELSAKQHPQGTDAPHLPQSADVGSLAGDLTRQDLFPQDAETEGRADLETARELPVDFQLHAPTSGDACLDHYRIHGEESMDCATAPLNTASLNTISLDTAPGASRAASSAQGSLLAFPRPLLEPPLLALPSRDELADPVHHRPRILEVPEDIMPAVQGSLFPEIRLDLEEPEICARREPEIEIPLPVAPLSMRLKAALTDLAVVAGGGGLFAAVLDRTLPELPQGKPFWVALTAVTILLWAVYQHLFLLYAGRTVGMRITGIRLSTFDGRPPRWSERRRRARFILISFASVALGFLWALVDEDTLCWHDRVSQTFPTRS